MRFSIYYANDAFTFKNKVMGRQSAGKSFLTGFLKYNESKDINALGQSSEDGHAMKRLLSEAGFIGQLKWSNLPSIESALETGVLYYPAPTPKEFAYLRNRQRMGGVSLMGVTHTLSSIAALEQIADLACFPFRPWDALICTSQAAKTLVVNLQSSVKEYLRENTGASMFSDLQLPVIPLGVNAQEFVRSEEQQSQAKQELGIQKGSIVFLFAGRLSFHAKSNPAPMYQALQAISKSHDIVCIEAGQFPNPAVRLAYEEAQKAMASNVKFIWVDGADEARYKKAWQCADIFVSLSDNVQETFGITPLEAMASGIPVVVSDWDGYKDTVRDGVDGFRVPTVLPPQGFGADLALCHSIGAISYDHYIGRVSMATVIEPKALQNAFSLLAGDEALRKKMGRSARQRVLTTYDWSVILPQYERLAGELSEIREAENTSQATNWPARKDPFELFEHFSTHTLQGNWSVEPVIEKFQDAQEQLEHLISLSMLNYSLQPKLEARQQLQKLLLFVSEHPGLLVNELLERTSLAHPLGVRGLMWLWKFNFVSLQTKI